MSRRNMALGLALAAFAVPAAAQSELQKACVQSLHPDGPDKPEMVLAALKPATDSGKWVGAMDSVIARFRRSSDAAPGAARSRMLAQLVSLRASLGTDVVPDSSIRSTAFNPQRQNDGSYRIFTGVPESEVVLTDSMPATALFALCYAAEEAASIANLSVKAYQGRFVRFLNERVSRWDNYRKAGPPMFLAEQIVNDWSPLAKLWSRAPLEPPSGRTLFLHPEVALAASAPLKSSPAFAEALVVEWLGGVRYNRKRDQFLSISLASLHGSGRKMLVGGAVRLSSYGQIGYYGGSESAVSISAALIQYGSRARERAESAAVTLRDAAARCHASLADCKLPKLP
jgi:hypothetical protein